jgi:hypothetical protein
MPLDCDRPDTLRRRGVHTAPGIAAPITMTVTSRAASNLFLCFPTELMCRSPAIALQSAFTNRGECVMSRTSRIFLPAAVVTTALTLAACATSSVSVQDLYRDNYGVNINPQPDISAPWSHTGSSNFVPQTQPCLMSNYRCNPQDQLRWAEDAQR